MSHSGDLLIIAVARQRSVGVDIEQMRSDIDIDHLALMHFTAREADSITRLAGTQKLKGFFDCWTRKEAYVKAVGDRSRSTALRFHCFRTSRRGSLRASIRYGR